MSYRLTLEEINPKSHDPDHGAALFYTNASAFLRIEKNIPIRFGKDIITGIITFLGNQPDFDIRNTSVETATTSPGAMKGIEGEAVPDVIRALSVLQRILTVASTPAEFKALMFLRLTSAFQIASMTVPDLIKKIATGFVMSPADVKKIHERATNISNGNYRVFTVLQQALRGSGMPAVDGTDSSKDRLTILGEVGGNTMKNINLEELFGDMDSDPCDDCNSVTSPAAYFVEILQFLRNNNLDPDNAITKANNLPLTGTVLERLFARRPDLGNLQLTCPNTNTILPYIDLANEVMESFVVHLEGHTVDGQGNITQAKLDVYNSSGTAGELLSEPQACTPFPSTPL